MSGHSCRSCGAPLDFVVVDLGAQPLANSYLSAEDLDRPEVHYPLCVLLCTSCFLVQVPAVVPADAIFSDYAYFSSYSDSWLDHARRYVEMAAERFALGAESLVIEVASNDGYLLRWFRDRGVPVLGIEPARNVAAHAEAAGIPTLVRFLGAETARLVVEGPDAARPRPGNGTSLTSEPAAARPRSGQGASPEPDAARPRPGRPVAAGLRPGRRSEMPSLAEVEGDARASSGVGAGAGLRPGRRSEMSASATMAGMPSGEEWSGGEDSVVPRAGLSAAVAARLGRPADLVVANNVFAHVPDLTDFTAGLRALLAPRGVLTIEVPHLLRLLDEVQFDTIYHEHFSYYSLHAASRVLAAHGLEVFDVEELPTHGGSLRLYCRRADAPRDDARLRDTGRVAVLLERERRGGLLDPETYRRFGTRVREVKLSLLRFLLEARQRGETVVAYGAPAKGNTLLNYCGVGPDLIDFTVDRSPHKQGRFLPGSRIPILAPELIAERRPQWVLILPWNLKDEIVRQMAEVREWGGRFVVPIPEVREV